MIDHPWLLQQRTRRYNCHHLKKKNIEAKEIDAFYGSKMDLGQHQNVLGYRKRCWATCKFKFKNLKFESQ